jgi:protein involved in polysaccharide export with SLBB domain
MKSWARLVLVLVGVPLLAASGEAQQVPRVYVTGHVVSEGRYPHEEGMTVQGALKLAGGVREHGDTDHIRLNRMTKDGRVSEAATLTTILLAGDNVHVPRRNASSFLSFH